MVTNKEAIRTVRHACKLKNGRVSKQHRHSLKMLADLADKVFNCTSSLTQGENLPVNRIKYCYQFMHAWRDFDKSFDQALKQSEQRLHKKRLKKKRRINSKQKSNKEPYYSDIESRRNPNHKRKPVR